MVDITFVRSRFTEHDAARMAREHFAIDGTARSLPSERDQNFRIDAADGRRFVLKIANATEDPAVLDLQTQALVHLETVAPGLDLPRLVPAAGGAASALVHDVSGRAHTVRLLTFVAGRTLASCRPHSPDLLRQLGALLGRLDRALESFDHPAADRPLKWDPKRAGWIRPYFTQVADETRRALVERLFDRSETALAALAPRLPVSVIYNDANDHNVLVECADPYSQYVTAVIDFGDMLRAWTVNELAVALAYAMLGKPDPLGAAAAIVAGYHGTRPLNDDERAALLPLVVRRLAVSVVNSAHQRHVDPANAYLFVTEQPAWELLTRLDTVAPNLALSAFRHACGLEPAPTASAVTEWLRGHREQIGPLLEPDLARSPRRVFDLSVSGADAGTPAVWADPALFSRHLRRLMEDGGAAVGIGRYDEVRACYASDVFVTAGNDGPEWRTIHLGLDLFVEPGTPVLAPLDGVVHSVADNQGALDYGPTVILEHEAPGTPGLRFFTLYGHLTRDSLAPLVPGRPIARGERVARIGDASVNGGWPPHLHFQIITDLLGRRGDFPGVAAPASRDVWLSLSPDPNLIADLPDAVRAPRYADAQGLLERRRAHLGPSLSVSYRRPLTIVRGWMQHLYDADGRAYLDAVNNVPHVGHCHPRVVDAGRRQMAVLNTNTRYLHDSIGTYAVRLCDTLPEPLRVCFFVNSGSEANELALRLARAATGRRDTLVVEVGYHGNTTTIVDISSYKFDGPGGTGAPPWVHAVPIPDTYRGRYRGTGPGVGAAYARHVAEALARMADTGTRPAAFIAESILSCGGQIVLPDGYLAACYDAVRGAGGLCIADEVQVGFGRAGRHFWAFESQGVVPDIVTMGKPAGNGHPLGIVVTTKAIADTFANGMEYFNTFGGNPVSCAIGLAVLDVVRDEGLQENALTVGNDLLARLRDVQGRHTLIGDVRGMGLFVGVELVRDRATLEPADREAGLVVNRMRERGVLVSTDGPFHNVIKIKPPMCVTRADADRLADTLDAVLDEQS
jgi:4-aminobutyrate aminotransferase-like enzyme/Ser/Thr protein kinase RdoA (MazF antagonist)